MEPSREIVIAYYRDRLAARLGGCFDPVAWEVQLKLALLGQCLRHFGLMLHNAYHGETAELRDIFRAQLSWWCEQARAGLQLL
jgi:hypothetical protein